MVLPSNPEVIAKRLKQASVLVDIPKSGIFELNETGTRIWELTGEGLGREITRGAWGQALLDG
jgi:Coenzyme PQQ synthesis protein D (PqqD)